MRSAALALLAAAALLAEANAAQAQSDSFLSGVLSPDTLHGMAQVSLGAADGETSWVDGGFGKTALSGAADGGWRSRARFDQAVVEWRPSFGFAFSAVVSAQWQSRAARPKFDLDEGYLKFKGAPSSAGRFSARAGLFYPPVSLENSGLGWSTTDLLSASALNSWIGEEVKVGGLEATYERRFGEHQIAATAAVFGWNDTSGSLLSFRGWALDGVRTGASTAYELPPLSDFIEYRQAEETYPIKEIDGRVGYYARLQWRPPAPVSVEAFYYDNRGDRVSVKAYQWAWETHFWNLGVDWRPDQATRVRAQALSGKTLMGFATPRTWVDVDYRAAYLLATHDLGSGALSGRVDAFDVRDHTYRTIDDNSETGWAATAGWRRPLSGHLDLFLEAQHVWSKRPARALANEAAKQDQNLVQSALRLHF